MPRENFELIFNNEKMDLRHLMSAALRNCSKNMPDIRRFCHKNTKLFLLRRNAIQ